MKHTLVALMQDRPGVLNRAVSLFRRRGFNIDSLAVGHSETAGVSRMTLVVDARDVDQAIKQLHRLIEVLSVTDVTNGAAVEREIALLRMSTAAGTRSDVLALAAAFGARTLDATATTVVLELAASPAKVDSFIAVMQPFGIREMTRSGRIAMVRGQGARLAADSPHATKAEAQLAVAS